MLKSFDVKSCSPRKIKESGVHYTPTELSYFVASQILLDMKLDKKKEYCLLDPSVGDGHLLYALTDSMKKLKVKKINIFGFDINKYAIKMAQEKFEELSNDYNLCFKHCDFLTESEKIDEKFDIVISNPPYVRTQVLGENKAQYFAKKYSLKGRVDLYYFFPCNIKCYVRQWSFGNNYF